jgi:hypothetical protein
VTAPFGGGPLWCGKPSLFRLCELIGVLAHRSIPSSSLASRRVV